MPAAVTYNAELQILEIQLGGEYTIAEAKEVLARTVDLLREHGCTSILADLRGAKVALSTMDIYSAPRMLGEAVAAAGIDVHRLRRAVIIEDDNPEARFLETVALNRGQALRIFSDVEAARAWLREA